MSGLTCLIYASKATPLATVDISATTAGILADSARNNARVGVTGMLLYHAGWFLQALEGSRISVQAVYGKVCRDKRHWDFRVLSQDAITDRAFKGWAMCGRNLTPADDEILDVLSMRGEFKPLLLTGAQAMHLLTTIHGVHLRTAA